MDYEKVKNSFVVINQEWLEKHLKLRTDHELGLSRFIKDDDKEFFLDDMEYKYQIKGENYCYNFDADFNQFLKNNEIDYELEFRRRCSKTSYGQKVGLAKMVQDGKNFEAPIICIKMGEKYSDGLDLRKVIEKGA